MQTIHGLGDLSSRVGQVLGTGEWLEVPQAMIDDFAATTRDRQWIHVDPERAAAGPYGTTIAHGYLVLSLLPELAATAYRVEGTTTRINYGLERVRFPAPVPAGSRLRVTSTLQSLEPTAAGVRIVVHNAVETEGGDKPACMADTVSVLVFGEPDEQRAS